MPSQVPLAIALAILVSASTPVLADCGGSVQYGIGSADVPVLACYVTPTGSAYTYSTSVAYTNPATPPHGWLSVSPSSGSIAAGVQGEIDYNIDPTGLPIGEYFATVTRRASGFTDAVDQIHLSVVNNVTQSSVSIVLPAISGVKVIVDGVSYTTNHTFTWLIGSVHTLSVPPLSNSGTTFIIKSADGSVVGNPVQITVVTVVIRLIVTQVTIGPGPGTATQNYNISTIAGGVPPPTPSPAINASIGAPFSVAVDKSGTVYFTAVNCVFTLDKNGTLNRVAGTSRAGYLGDKGPATAAELNFPTGLAIDDTGNLYVADTGNNRVRRVSADGIITTFAGRGTRGGEGDGGAATDAQLNQPIGVAVDKTRNVYIADSENNRIRKVAQGVITTVAGGGKLGDGAPATAASLGLPYDVKIDGQGNIYISDQGHASIRKIGADGTINTIAGGLFNGTSLGDGGPALKATLNDPAGIAVDDSGNVFVADMNNNRIRKISRDGNISTVAGNGSNGYQGEGEGGPATNASLSIPTGVSVDGSGNLYIADEVGIRQVNTGGLLRRIAGNNTFPFSGDGGPAANAQLGLPQAVALDAAGNVYFSANQNVRKIAANGSISSVAGNRGGGSGGYSGDNGLATSAALFLPHGITFTPNGDLYIADYGNNRLRRVDSKGVITTIAGNGVEGYSGDGGAATLAALDEPTGVAVDRGGNVYFADTRNNRVRKVSASGTISTLAGNGIQGFSGDGGPAANASLDSPVDVVLDSAGNVYIADAGNHRIRKVSPTGMIDTVVGNGTPGYSGDGGSPLTAQLSSPGGIAVDTAGNLYISDSGNSAIRKVFVGGMIMTIAGDGTRGYSGDSLPATSAKLNGPQGLAVDSSGRVYFADWANNAIRMLQPISASLPIVNQVANAASYARPAVSPGEIVVVQGVGLGPGQLTLGHLANNGYFDTQASGTQVFFNGTAAPIIYSWATAVAAIVPYSVSGTTAQVTVGYQGQTSSPTTINVVPAVPALFTSDASGKGQAAAANQNGTINGAATPATAGEVIALFATGEGQTNPPGIDGKPASDPLPKPVLPVSVTIGGQPAQVQYYGGAPGEVAGVMQVNVVVPNGVTGSVPVVLKVGEASTQSGVTIAVQ